MSSTLPTEAAGDGLSRLQAEQTHRYRNTWRGAGHDWTPRVSASRSIVPIVSETDRSLFGLRGEDSHDDVGVIGFFVREGVVGAGGAGGSAFRSPARSYPETRGRIRGCVVVLRVARSYLRGTLRYDRVELCTTACSGGTTTRFYARPGGTAYDRAGPVAHGDEAAALPGAPGFTGQRRAAHGPAARSARTSGPTRRDR